MTAMSHTSAYATSALTQPMPNARSESSRMRLSRVKSAKRSSTLSALLLTEVLRRDFFCSRERRTRTTRASSQRRTRSRPRTHTLGAARIKLKFIVWSQTVPHFTSEDGRVSGEEAADAFDDVLLLLAGQLRDHRQRERLACGALGFGEVALRVAEVREAFLHVQRNGVVNLRAHAVLLEVFDERVTSSRRDAYDVL